MRHALTLLTLLALLSSCAYKNKEADLVVHNARIVTLDSVEHVYQAMAIKDGRIVELGPEQQILNRYRAKEEYDAAGQTVYPGFIDGHCHFLGYGLGRAECDLVGTRSWKEVVERVKAYGASAKTEWIIGRGWDQNDWAVKDFPTRRELDTLFPDRPVMLVRIDGHAAIANAAALHKAKITSDSHIAGGEIKGELINGGDASWTRRDAVDEIRHIGYPFWEPTGLLVDNAVDLLNKVIPEPTEAMMREALLRAQTDCFDAGLTMVCDAGLDRNAIELIRKMQDEGVLKMRVYAMLSDKTENLAHYEKEGPIITDRLIVHCVKVYADGALGSRGALLLKGYNDIDSVHHGLQLNTRAHFIEVAQWCKQQGFQMATHCIGDSANRLMLGVYGEVLGGSNDRRWRIEHAQCMDTTDFPLFAKFNVIPSVQPTHATSDMLWAIDRIGPARLVNAYAYERLLKQNGLVALGTDFPVEAIDPLKTFYAAVLRKNADGVPANGFQMSDALTRDQALRGMTQWNAIATFTENDLGTLEVGKRADFTVVNLDLLKASEAELLKSKVVGTFVGGEKMSR